VQLAHINRMRGIVIIDPVVHRRKGPAKTGFRCRNRRVYDALARPASVGRRVPGFLTGRFIVSKAKSDKVSPDLDTPTDLSPEAVEKISAAVNPLIADAFALYLKTKNFHWHISGRHFRDYHLMLDEQGEAIFAQIDDLAERIRKIGGTTMRS